MGVEQAGGPGKWRWKALIGVSKIICALALCQGLYSSLFLCDCVRELYFTLFSFLILLEERLMFTIVFDIIGMDSKTRKHIRYVNKELSQEDQGPEVMCKKGMSNNGNAIIKGAAVRCQMQLIPTCNNQVLSTTDGALCREFGWYRTVLWR